MKGVRIFNNYCTYCTFIIKFILIMKITMFILSYRCSDIKVQNIIWFNNDFCCFLKLEVIFKSFIIPFTQTIWEVFPMRINRCDIFFCLIFSLIQFLTIRIFNNIKIKVFSSMKENIPSNIYFQCILNIWIFNN